jgi:hypothetical protein
MLEGCVLVGSEHIVDGRDLQGVDRHMSNGLGASDGVARGVGDDASHDWNGTPYLRCGDFDEAREFFDR